MSDTRQRKNWGIDGQRQAVAAALPPLLFGLGIALASLVRGGPWYAVPFWRLILSVVVGFIPAAVIAGGGFVALVRRLPDWGYTWVGASLMGLLLLAKTTTEELAEEGTFLISPLEGPLVGVLILLAVLAALSVAALRGWRQAGLVSIGLSATFGLSLCFAVTAGPSHRHDLALLAGPLGLLSAALIYAYARGSRLVPIAVFLALWLLNAGLVWMANRVWQPWLVAGGKPSPAWPLMVLLTGLLLVGPSSPAWWSWPTVDSFLDPPKLFRPRIRSGELYRGSIDKPAVMCYTDVWCESYDVCRGSYDSDG